MFTSSFPSSKVKAHPASTLASLPWFPSRLSSVFSVWTHVRPSGCFLSSQVYLPAVFEGCQQPPQDRNSPLRQPSSPVLQSSPVFLYLYPIMTSRGLRTHVQVCERLFVRALWSHCPPPPSSVWRLPHSEEGGPETHLPQTSTNLRLPDGSALMRCWTLHACSDSGGNSSWRLSHRRSSTINYARL